MFSRNCITGKMESINLLTSHHARKNVTIYDFVTISGCSDHIVGEICLLWGVIQHYNIVTIETLKKSH
jgi:hypothetical protein